MHSLIHSAPSDQSDVCSGEYLTGLKGSQSRPADDISISLELFRRLGRYFLRTQGGNWLECNEYVFAVFKRFGFGETVLTSFSGLQWEIVGLFPRSRAKDTLILILPP